MSLILLWQDESQAPWIPPLLPGGAWALLINGVDVSMKVNKRSLRGEMTRGARSVLSFEIVDALVGEDAYIPDLDDEVIFAKEGEPIIGGYLTDKSESPISGISGGTKTACRVSDWSVILDRVFATASFGDRFVPIQISVGNPANIRTDGAHGFHTGERVLIEGHTPGSPDINGVQTITETADPMVFTIPVAISSSGGGGTVRRLWTFREVVEALMVDLLPWGLTLAPGTPNGPYMSPLTLNNASIAEIYQHLTQETGLIYRVAGNKVIYWFTPGQAFAPFVLNGDNTNAPVQTQKTRNQFSNWVIVEYGGEQKLVTSQIFKGTGVAGPGNLTRYVTDFKASNDINNDPWPNMLIVNGVAKGPVAWGPWFPGSAFTWHWDYEAHALVHNDAPGVYPTANDLITVGYTAQFPAEAEAKDLVSLPLPPVGKGPWRKRVSAPKVTNKAQAQAIADGLLRMSNRDLRSLQTGTLEGLALPGDLIPLTFPRRNVDGDWLIETTKFQLWGPRLFYYEYTFTEGLDAPPTWIDNMKELTGQTGAGSGSISGGSPPISILYPPNVPVSTGKPPYFLGGVANVGVNAEANTWIAATGDPAGQSAIRVEIDTNKFGTTGTVSVRLKTMQAGTGVTARLWRTDGGGAEVGISSLVTSQQYTTVEFPVTYSAGAHSYELQLRPDTTGVDVFGVGYIKP